MARGFGNTDVTRYHSLINLITEKATCIGGYQIREVVAAIKHGQYDALQDEVGVKTMPDQFDRVNQLTDSFQSEKLALQRHKNRTRSH